MSIFEEMIVKAKSMAECVGEKAGNFVDMSKLKISIAEENNELKKKFESLGKFVYDSEKNGMGDKISIQHYIDEIDSIQKNIEKMEKEMSMLKKQVMCSKCGCKNQSDAKYCSNCGSELAVRCEVIKKNHLDEEDNSEN